MLYVCFRIGFKEVPKIHYESNCIVSDDTKYSLCDNYFFQHWFKVWTIFILTVTVQHWDPTPSNSKNITGQYWTAISTMWIRWLVSCWWDIRKSLARGGCAWMMCTVCVIIVLSPAAPVGVLPKRQHSPWWASARTITSSHSIVTGEALVCHCVNCVNLPFRRVWTFHFLLLTFTFTLFFCILPVVYAITIHLSFENAANVNDMHQLEWDLHKPQQCTNQKRHIIGQNHKFNLT